MSKICWDFMEPWIMTWFSLVGGMGGDPPQSKNCPLHLPLWFSLPLNHFSTPTNCWLWRNDSFKVHLTVSIIYALFYKNLNKKLNKSYDIQVRVCWTAYPMKAVESGFLIPKWPCLSDTLNSKCGVQNWRGRGLSQPSTFLIGKPSWATIVSDLGNLGFTF